ncbi:uncharacterized protein Dvar_01870 [Desulfosarcina variabilis str. Montpellier]
MLQFQKQCLDDNQKKQRFKSLKTLCTMIRSRAYPVPTDHPGV